MKIKIFVILYSLLKTLKYYYLHQYKKSDEAVLIVYAELECIIEKIDTCKYNPENSSITKESEHIYQVLQYLHYLHLEA